jgi:hypothetical protein
LLTDYTGFRWRPRPPKQDLPGKIFRVWEENAQRQDPAEKYPSRETIKGHAEASYFAALGPGSLPGLAAIGSNFLFYSPDSIGRNLNKLHTDANPGETIPYLTASADLDACFCQAKLNVEYCAFGKAPIRVDEHSLRADIRRTRCDVFAIAFIGDGEIAKTGIAGSLARRAPTLPMVSCAHSLAAPCSTKG